MRFYDIQITDPTSGREVKRYTSWVNNQNDPGALNVELDIPVAPFAAPMGFAFVRIWGISLQDIGQANNYNPNLPATQQTNFNFKNVTVSGGMQAGLPLAKPRQNGVLIAGQINQAFGNWRGTEMTLDFIISTGASPPDQDLNLTQNWTAGTPLADAIRQTLTTAFPGYTADVNISSDLVLAHDEPGFYGSLEQYAGYVKQFSKDVLGGTYQGVDVVLHGKKFVVYDGTSPTAPTQLAFEDLVGQPTWFEPGRITWSCVMRADLATGDYVKLPVGTIVATESASQSQYKNSSSFQGVYQIDLVRHVGNFRYPDGAFWATTYQGHQASG